MTIYRIILAIVLILGPCQHNSRQKEREREADLIVVDHPQDLPALVPWARAFSPSRSLLPVFPLLLLSPASLGEGFTPPRDPPRTSLHRFFQTRVPGAIWAPFRPQVGSQIASKSIENGLPKQCPQNAEKRYGKKHARNSLAGV